ncbi:MAG: aspartate-semialdehyde dehydrogenase [Lactobacillaceae bacterium]|jgi:aspartate-semialdehyde dehydrogenase|nr:aspartate-semialdehyde dehydrogenase [Lactobacillaceae bacterium]
MKIAVVGVMDSVGREILSFLEEDNFPAKSIFAVENKTPLGVQVSYGEDYDLDVYNLDDFDFSKADIAIFATSNEISKRYVPGALAKNIKVVDCSSAFFSRQDVPVIVSGVNDEKINAAENLIMIPSPASMQLLLPIKEINERYGVKRIVTTSYTSTSYYGREAMDELFSQTRKIYSNDSLADNEKIFKKQIAFNVIPQVGEFIGDETKLEWAVNAEVKKVLGPNVKVHANCAFVPAFIGLAQFVNVECEEDIDVDDVRELMAETKGVVVFDKNLDGGYFCLTDVQGENNVYVSRLRQDISVENGISFWVVADNLRVGIAKNAYEIMKKFFDKK